LGIVLLAPAPLSAAGLSDDLPLAAGICVNKANLFIRDGRPGEAVKVLEAFREKKKEGTHYYIDFLLGNCFMTMDKAGGNYLTRAAKAYERAVAKQPELSPAWLNLAQCRYSSGEMEPAAKAFIRGYETAEEKNAETLYYGAACWFFARKHKAALDTFYQLLDRHKDQVKPEWMEILVNTLFALGKNREALPWLQNLARESTGEKLKQWQEVLLYQYVTLEMDRAALDYARYLTRNDPGEPKWWKSLSHIHLGKNRLEKGLQSLMIYGFLTPLSPSETRLLADLYSACNIPLEAARCYEDWVAQMNKPGSLNVAKKILKIANAYIRGGDKAAALAWVNKGLAMEKHAGLLGLKADLLFRDRKYEAALTVCEQLAEFKSEQGRAQLMAGYAAWNLGKLDRAVKAFGLAALDPKQKRAARTALSQIKKNRESQLRPAHSHL